MYRSVHRSLATLTIVAVGTTAPLQAQDYGWAVATTGEEVFVAESGNEAKPGIVYVYRPTGGSWTEAGKLTASDAERGDHFGRALAVEGTTLMIAATVVDDSRGAVYFFERGATGDWEQVARLQPEGLAAGDALGMMGAIDGDYAIVGSRAQNDAAGAVYTFHRVAAGEWSFGQRLTASDAAAGRFFGYSLALEDDLAIVGTPLPDQQQGAAYIFRRDPVTGSWVEEARLRASDGARGHAFGNAVGVVDGRVLVGAPGRDRGTGGVYVFERDAENGEWGETSILLPFDGPRAARFGSAIHRHGPEVWVGAPGVGGFAGAVYPLRRDPETDQFTAAVKLAPGEAERGDGFGSAIAVGGAVAVVAAGFDDYGAGSAYIFERRDDGSIDRDGVRIVSTDSGLDPIVGTRVECAEGSAALFDCKDVDILSFLPVRAIGGARGASVNDVWGWTDPQTGREYALVGRTAGTSFIDITDPRDPVYLGDLPMTEGANGSTWRDIKVYANHAFIVSDGAGPHGMQVFDLTRLRNVVDPPTEFEATVLYERIWSAHNIVINEETGFAYAVGSNGGGETCGGGLHMIDINEPLNPSFAGCFADTETGFEGTGYSHDAMCVVYQGPDTEHVGKEICFGANENALSISDVTDKEAPVALSNATYPSVAYAHQGWISEDHRYFYMDDESDELNTVFPGTRTLIWDIADLDDPILVKEHFGETFTSDHNLYIKGDLMYQSNYLSGLRILDISDPLNPIEVGFFDTVPWSEQPEMAGSWSNYPYFESGTIVVTSGREGVFFLEKRKPQLVP